jgi:hypothetical protein
MRKTWIWSYCRRLFAARVCLPSGRDVLVSRLTGWDVWDLSEARPRFETDADAAGWLVERLVQDVCGRGGTVRANELSAIDLQCLVDSIMSAHAAKHGIWLFSPIDELRPTSSREQHRHRPYVVSLLDFVDRYIALDHLVGTAINAAACPGP